MLHFNVLCKCFQNWIFLINTQYVINVINGDCFKKNL